MLNGFTGLLLLQLAGEGIARALALPVPGPIIGFVLLLGVLRLRPRWTAPLKLAADGLLSHLSLLFIPAGVGVVMHLKAIREEGLAITVALAVSTLVGLAVTAWVAERLASANLLQKARLLGMRDDFFRLWVYLSTTPLLGLTLTLVAYQIGLWLARRSGNHPLVNPVLVAMLVVAATLAFTGVSYQQYFEGAQFVHFLLGTATVALGLPFYERLAELRASWRSLVTGLVCGSVAATATVYGLAKYLGVSESTARSLLPKSVTAPIAMGISEAIGGVPALSAVFAILTGVLGAATGKIVFDLLGIKSMMVRGFALGAQAHGIGTARAYLVSADAGAFAGLALGLHGLMASLLLPWVVRWML